MSFKTIVLKGEPPQFEALAAATLYPGYLVRISSATQINVHATVGQKCATMFVIENSLEGQEIATAYSSGDVTQYVHARPGDEILAVLKNGQNVSAGGLLESAGDGSLQAYVADSAGAAEPDIAIAVALESLNLSSSAAGDVLSERRIKVRII